MPGQPGLHVLFCVEEERRPDLEPAPTRPLQTVELTVKEKVLKLENVTLKNVQVRIQKLIRFRS